jgi:AraC-like DNA-binding protein
VDASALPRREASAAAAWPEDAVLRGITRVDRLVFRSPLVAMATFRCAPDDPMFEDSGPARNAIFVFPRTAVRIQHEGARAFVAGPNLVTFYNPGQVYRRSRVGSEGDECDWYWVEPGTLRQVLCRYDPPVVDRPERPFRFAWGPSDPQTYLEQRAALLHALGSPNPDRLYLEETIVRVLERVVASALRARARRERETAGAIRRQSDLTEAAKTLLAEREGDPLDLAGLSSRLGCSPFHLCHVFRLRTGFTLSQYQHQARLRRSLARVADRSTRLTDLASDLGYASHSHFTYFFRRAFGLTPSAWRRRAATAGTATHAGA